MSNSIIGHNIEPVVLTTEWEVEVDDDEYEDMEGELVEEQMCLGYRGIVPKNSNSTTVTISFYYYAPTSEWYWDYNYGIPYKPIIPVIFATDANWNLTECLNSSLNEVSLTGQANGWVNISVSLIRKLVEGEKIFFGIYSDIIGFVGDYIDDPDTTMCYLYWTRALRRDYNSQIAYLSSPDFIRRQYGIFSDYEICIYLEYENEPDGFFYTRSVIGNVGAYGAFAGRSLKAFRLKNDATEITGISSRILCKIFVNSDTLSLTDAAQKLLLLLRSVFSLSVLSESVSRKSVLKKSISSAVENVEQVKRLWEISRSFEDNIVIEARSFASRIFYRVLETVMSFWDWLRGKIREANNVVSFYCPIWTEIEMECRI